MGHCCQEFIGPLLSRGHRAIVAKNLLGIDCRQELLDRCCQEHVKMSLPRVYQAVVAKSLSGHSCQQFVGVFLPRVCWGIFKKSSSGHCWQMVSLGTTSKADILMVANSLPMLARLLYATWVITAFCLSAAAFI